MDIVIDIFYVKYLTEDGKLLSVGGIESYIYHLTELAHTLNIQTRVFQFADEDFNEVYHNTIVYGVKSKSESFDILWNTALSVRNKSGRYLSIIANDSLIPSWKVPNSIVIQHGIGFDSTSTKHRPIIIEFLYKAYYAYKRVKRIYNIDECVCVDNNYINWFHTQIMRRDIKMTPILNFAKIRPTQVKRDNSIVKIVFARRGVQIRGTHLFASAAHRLLNEFNNIEITFAGNGSEEEYLINTFQGYERVKFTEFTTVDSIEFHQKYHIAVVPTIYSEGTSLSLLEAMSSHCAVISTNIGGLSNIIIDGYNGLMISPDVDELYASMSLLIQNETLRDSLAINAYETVKTSFSIEKWKLAWTKILMKRCKLI